MYWLAFLTGLMGSLHCAGMCGPIVLALPLEEKKSTFFINKSIYNLARIPAYVIIGLVFGLIGNMGQAFGIQQNISIITGVILLIYGITLLFFHRKLAIKGFSNGIVRLMQPFMKKKGSLAMFMLGFLNGFLPCGLVYIAAAYCIQAPEIHQSALIMVFFGLGTFPAMYSLSLSKLIFKTKSLKRFSTKVAPIISIIIGIVLLIRGLGLNIPYLSPTFKADEKKIECCKE